MAKRYYWLKLKEDFFSSKRIKKLRRLAGGDTYTIIYLKIQLKAMKTDGTLVFDHLENSFAEELALDIDEEPDNVQVTLNYLLSCGLAEASDKDAFFFPYSIENTGSETSSAQRVRECRARKAAAALPEGNGEGNADGNTPESLGNADALQCNGEALHCNNSVTERKSKSKREDIELDIESDKEIEGSGGKEEAREFLELGMYGNVLLTPSDYERLKNAFPDCDAAINRLSVKLFNGRSFDGVSHYDFLKGYLTEKLVKNERVVNPLTPERKSEPEKRNRDQNFNDMRNEAIAKLQEGR